MLHMKSFIHRILHKKTDHEINQNSQLSQDEKEIEEAMLSLLNLEVLGKKEERELKALVLEHTEIAEALYHKTNLAKRDWILIFLTSEGKGIVLAKEEIKRWAYAFDVINCTKEEELLFKQWLSGDSDVLPPVMPMERYRGIGFPVRANIKLCYLSRVSTFTERVCVYAIHIGNVDLMKGIFDEMISQIGIDDIKTFLQHMVETYHISMEAYMQMISSMYVVSRKKVTQTFLSEYIQEWIKNYKEQYICAINKLSYDMRKKILRNIRSTDSFISME